MSILESIYDKSPIWWQNIMCTISGYQRNSKRYGKAYREHRKFLREFDAWSLQEQLEYQQKALAEFLRYVVENSEFYRELYKGIDVLSIQNVAALKQLPAVDKETLRINIEKVVTIPRLGAVEDHTGGTTGKSLIVINTAEDSMKGHAMLDHFKERVGFVNRKMRRATFNGKHIIPPGQKKKIYWRYNRACKQMIYSSFNLTEENMKYYVASLNQFKPHAIDGFFSSICDVANYIERHGIYLNFTPVAIFPTSETLTEEGRKLIERVFKCKAYDQYASSEGAPFIAECLKQTLHIDLSSGIFERISDDSDEVLVTSFTTHGTPLVRYRIGDEMIFSNAACTCGLCSPTVRKIQGRRLDFLYTAEGAKINAGNIANIFKNIPNALIRTQLIQNKVNEITMLLEVDKRIYKPVYDNLLFKEFKHKFGSNMKLSIIHVDEIPREKSGKFRMIKNNIEEQLNG